MNHKQTALAALALLALTAPAAAELSFLDWLNPRKNPPLSAKFETDGRCKQNADPGSEDMGWMDYDLTASVPVWSNDRQDVTVLGRFRAIDICSDALLPKTGERFPDALYDIQLGGLYRHKFDNGWLAGLKAGFGSRSDEPFATADEWTVDATAFLRIPAGEHNAWVVLLSYDNTRTFLRHAPLPGGGYLYSPDRSLTVLAGVPFSMVRWVPVERLTLSAMYGFPRRLHAEAEYELVKDVKVFAAFDWTNMSFLRHGRGDYRNRLAYHEKRLGGGVRWRISEQVSLEAAAGAAFDRFWYEAKEYDDRHGTKIDLDCGPFAKVNVAVRF